MARLTFVTIAVLAGAFSALAQPRPKFEVASVKLCRPADTPPGGAGRKGAGASGNDPGHLNMACQTVERLIQAAYIRFADGKPQTMPRTVTPRQMNQPIEGLPGWATSEQYTIEAKP